MSAVSYEFLGVPCGNPDDLVGKPYSAGGQTGDLVGLAAIGGVNPLLGPCAKIVYEGTAPETLFPRPPAEVILHVWGDFS